MVRNIHDDNHRFPKGIIEVTAVDLKYKDAKSGDEWVWPLKYLRKYGCDREIFSFEAGRKCPGGEGLYAFSTKKASQLFDMVARNISDGGLLENDLSALSPHDGSRVPSRSPVSSVPPPVPSPNPPPPPASDPPTHPPMPNYQNMSYQGGAPLLDEVPVPLPNEHRNSNTSTATPSPPPRPLNYSQVDLPEPAEESVIGNGDKRVPYQQIDLKQTEEYRRQMALKEAEAHPLPDLSNGEITIIKPSDKGNGQARVLSSGTHRSMSENFHTTERDNHLKKNGIVPRSHSHSTSAVPDQPNYQNITVSKSLTPAKITPPAIPEVPETQGNYMNLTPQPSLVRKQSDQPQQTYENLVVGSAGPRTLVGTPPRLISKDPHSTYADLDLPKTSTPKPRHLDENEHHALITFTSGSIASRTPAPRQHSSSSPPPADLQFSPTKQDAKTRDDSMVQYVSMNFEVMDALAKTREEREEEIRARMEKEEKEKEAKEEEKRKKEEQEKSSTAVKKKKKQNKKKDRRNSQQ